MKIIPYTYTYVASSSFNDKAWSMYISFSRPKATPKKLNTLTWGLHQQLVNSLYSPIDQWESPQHLWLAFRRVFTELGVLWQVLHSHVILLELFQQLRDFFTSSASITFSGKSKYSLLTHSLSQSPNIVLLFPFRICVGILVAVRSKIRIVSEKIWMNLLLHWVKINNIAIIPWEDEIVRQRRNGTSHHE
jgi:hypothetical protein